MRSLLSYITVLLYLGTMLGLMARGMTNPEEFAPQPVIPSSIVPGGGVEEEKEEHSEPEIDPLELILTNREAPWRSAA